MAVMNALARQKLMELVARFGRALGTDPRRCEALLRDVCPQARREIAVLTGSVREGIPAELLAASAGTPKEALLGRLSHRLQDQLGLREDLARWAVESWALALGLLAVEEPTCAPSAAPASAGMPAPADDLFADFPRVSPEETLRHAVRIVLADGIVTDVERAEIQHLRSALGIAPDAARRILDEVRAEQGLSGPAPAGGGDAGHAVVADLRELERVVLRGNVCLEGFPATEPSREAAVVFVQECTAPRRDAWHRAAAAGVPAGKALVGIELAVRRGFVLGPAELAEGLGLLRAAGDAGWGIAYYVLARVDGEPNRTAWLQRSAAAGFAEAGCALGKTRWWFPEGPGAPQHQAARQTAVAWFRQAAEGGSLEACFRMAEAYDRGWGVAPDAAESLRWLRRAAEAGHVLACQELGRRCELGLQGAARDPAEAAKWYATVRGSNWFRAAVATGHAEALVSGTLLAVSSAGGAAPARGGDPYGLAHAAGSAGYGGGQTLYGIGSHLIAPGQSSGRPLGAGIKRL